MIRWLPYVHNKDYEVSDSGLVRNAHTKRVMLGASNRSGYRVIGFRKGGRPNRRQSHTVHKMVMQTFVGPRKEGYCVDHINRSRQDNRLCNLRYITISENSKQGGVTMRGRKRPMEHIINVSRAVVGEKNWLSKLTNEQRCEIWRLFSNGIYYKVICEKYNIKKSLVYLIAKMTLANGILKVPGNISGIPYTQSVKDAGVK